MHYWGCELAKSVKVEKSTKTRLSQADVPSCSLDKALRVAQTVAENYGYKASTPIEVASAMNVSPATGPFRALTGASIAYGLTEGGYGADRIAITPLGLKIVRPTAEGEDLGAKRDALLKPRVIREFLTKYDGAQIPKGDIGRNVLETLGVPRERSGSVLELIIEGAGSVGFLKTIKDRKWVDLKGISQAGEEPDVSDSEEKSGIESGLTPGKALPTQITISPTHAVDERAKKVFITHGKNKNFAEPIKGLLSYGELEPVVATESHTASLPVPLKVMGHMRSCGAAIIHVEGERKLFDADTKEVVALNENVLIEIGAAMALYGDRFILLVKDGVKLPSNLQGLYEVRYTGETLDANDTVKLLGAIKDMKNRPLPPRP